MTDNQREALFQKHLKDRIRKEFVGSQVLKNDPNDIQGIPDLTIFYKKKWATLEVKAYKDAPMQPNQDVYVEKHNKMSFSSFIYPENEELIFAALHKHFKK